jgi:hypothetical protein
MALKENPAGVGPRGVIRQSRKGNGLACSELEVSRIWRERYYFSVKAKAIPYIYMPKLLIFND